MKSSHRLHWLAASVAVLGIASSARATVVVTCFGPEPHTLQECFDKAEHKIDIRCVAVEDVNRLANQAADAEANPTGKFGHGVSVTTPASHLRLSTNTEDAVMATRKQIEDAGFRLKFSGTKPDSHHHTLLLPKPVTPETVNTFNKVFGRKKR